MSRFRFDLQAKRFKANMKGLLNSLADDSVRFFKVEVFDNQGWEGRRWKPRKRDKGSDVGRPILVKTGRLRRSIHKIAVRYTDMSFEVGTNVKYANFHNRGTGRIPKRQFIGNSPTLNKRLRKRIEAFKAQNL